MQNDQLMERSKEAQSAQTVQVKPKWHKTVLHIVYYVILIAFLVFYMLPFWGAVVSSFKSNTEATTSSPIALPQTWSMEGYSGAMDKLMERRYEEGGEAFLPCRHIPKCRGSWKPAGTACLTAGSPIRSPTG